MENKQPSKLKSALNYGATLGLILMVLNLLVYVFEMYDSSWLTWLGMLVMIAGIVYGIKLYRDKVKGGFVRYGDALGYGTMVTLFASIITAFVTYVYLDFVDDGFLTYQTEQVEEKLYESGLSDDMIEQQLELQGKFLKPAPIALMSIVSSTFFGFIVSLIAGAFLKREPENFDDVD